MFNIKRRKHLYTIALRHSHIQLYKTEKGDSLGKNVYFSGFSVCEGRGVAATAMPNMEIMRSYVTE